MNSTEINSTKLNPTLNHLQREIAASLHDLNTTQTQLQPPSRPNKWSIQQIVEHLLLTYSSTEAAISARLAKGTPIRAKPTFAARFTQYAVTRCGYFPRGRAAPSIVTPQLSTHPLSGAELAQSAAEHLTRLDLLFNQAQALFGPATQCVTHNVLGPLNITQWRRFHLVHGRHHLKQIAAIRKAHHI